ncbi:MAG TPA: asparagine synthase (glutamine-hydrolyzing) [Puia sp.]|jgi:asparagine synthase (glutamine-hydrolysing)|nr:asparagine synthase (glutamine-hydrolyzing) [Puia sp.]
MCGIAGILNFSDQPIEQSVIQKMTDAISHRGPDADGFFSENKISFGHRRLSIIDLSSAANQPFIDNSGRYIITFNGEIYNYKQVKKLLPEYNFKTSGDTEVIIAAYAKWKESCLQYFSGMFAFAIWDRQENELFIARDRFGVKPLYYFIDDNKFLFASEVRAILASDLVKRKINTTALLEYFTYQSFSYPYSPVQDIFQLEAASLMIIKNKKIVKKKYWNVSQPLSDFDFADEKRVHEKVKSLMLQSVERRLVSDVPVGAFLSGGIDSSSIVGLMAEAGNGKPNTFNISFEEKDFDESYYADVVAKKFNTNHTRILLKPVTFLDELQNAVAALDSPSGDGINTYVVSKVIRGKGIKVALSGIGGDELFAGYPLFDQFLQLRKNAWLWKLPVNARNLLANIFFKKQSANKQDRLMQLLNLNSPEIENVYPVSRQILSRKLIASLTTLLQEDGNEFCTAVQRELINQKENIERLPLLSQVSVAEYLGYTQHTLLKDTDQMSMASSLEVREPFFDPDLVQFVLSVPDKCKKGNYPKKLLIESLKPLLPAEITERKKQGFLFPWELWLKNELYLFCEISINSISKRDFINGENLKKYWNNFLNGDKNTRWSEIWLFVVLENWMEKNGIE